MVKSYLLGAFFFTLWPLEAVRNSAREQLKPSNLWWRFLFWMSLLPVICYQRATCVFLCFHGFLVKIAKSYLLGTFFSLLWARGGVRNNCCEQVNASKVCRWFLFFMSLRPDIWYHRATCVFVTCKIFLWKWWSHMCYVPISLRCGI